MNHKPIIGILPVSNYFKTDNPSKDTYLFTNTYIDALIKCDGIPYFIPLHNDEIIEGSLDNLDGLFLQGGFWVSQAHFDALSYFYNKKLPILGVCLGMQEIAMFSSNLEEKGRVMSDITTGVNHRPHELTRDNYTTLVHNINIEKDSILFDIFKKDHLMVNSLHTHTVTGTGSMFNITAKSDDGLIECIEYNKDDRYIMGVQFHPELNDDLLPVYKRFVDECKRNDL